MLDFRLSYRVPARRLTTLLALTLGAGALAVAQAPPFDCSWEQAIGQPGMNGAVWTLANLEDGEGASLYAGGAFSTAGGTDASGIARWVDGEWHPLGGGVGGVNNPIVYAIEWFDDGSGTALYAGGQFTAAGGEAAHRIARWDGEAWSPVGDGLDNNVRALAVFDDGTGPALYAGGTFQNSGGEPIVGIARWDGEEWAALGDGLGGGLPFVYALQVFDDGTGPALYAGGTFITAGGEPATNIARWDGEAWSDVGGGVDQWVTAFTVFDDGSGAALYVGGAFGNAGGTTAPRVARWDGETWTGLGPGVTGDFPWVEALTGFDDGTGPALHVGGWFEVAGGQPANRIAKWDGEAWHHLQAGLNERVWDLLPFDDGEGTALYVAGHFTQAGGLPANRIARWVCKKPVATEGDPTEAAGLSLFSYPNPASTTVFFTFDLPEAGPAHLAVYDVLGRRVDTVADVEMASGEHIIRWELAGLAPGTYVARLTTELEDARRMLLVVR